MEVQGLISIEDNNTPLVAAFEDEISQEANSDYKLSFKYPAKHEYRPLIKKGITLESDDLHGTQLFRVFEITKRHGYINVYANQITDDLNGYAIDSISVDRVQGMTVMSELAGSIKREHPFSFFSDIDGRHTFNQSDVSAMDALANGKHSIMGQWGGELVRDKYQVNLLKKAGKDTEALFMYKKNLKSYEETDTIKGLVSILHLVAEVEEQRSLQDGEREASGEVIGQNESSKKKTIRVTVESKLKDTHPIIVEKTIKVQDQDVKTEEDLLEYGKKYFEKTLCDIPGNSLKIDVTNNYEGNINLFDTAIVFHELYDRDLRMQITGYKFSPMANRLKSISFGEIKTNLAKQISSQIDSKVDEATAQHDAAFEAKLQKQINNADRVFDAKENQLRQEIEDGIQKAEANAEIKVAEVNAKVLEAEKLAKEVDERLVEFLRDTEAKQKEFEETLRNLSLPEDAIKKITEAIKIDSIPDIKQAFDEIKDTVSETSETSKINAQIIGSDGKTRYSKNLLVGDPNRTKAYDQDYIELEANDGGFKEGETYTISFNQACELLQKVAITLTQKNNKGVKLVLTPTKAKMEPETFTLDKDSNAIKTYPFSFTGVLTGDWYKSKVIDLNASEAKEIALEMTYKEIADARGAILVGKQSKKPKIIFDGRRNT
ncbi:phage tail spike protein [Streptococcus phocae subsp. phocae]